MPMYILNSCVMKDNTSQKKLQKKKIISPVYNSSEAEFKLKIYKYDPAFFPSYFFI